MTRILVAEDEERLCLAIMAFLKSQGANPVAVVSAQEAVCALDTDEIDLVVLDLRLSDGNGLDVLKHIRGSPELVDLPVLAVSAWEMEPVSYDYLDPGDYLTKPFDMRILDLRIRQLLGIPQDQCLGRDEIGSPRDAVLDQSL